MNQSIKQDFLSMAANRRCTYQVVTEQPEQVAVWWEANSAFFDGWPANIWLGVLASNQQQVDERILDLIKVPATVRFVKMQPLLQRVNLNIGNLLHLPACPKSPLNNHLWGGMDCDCREYHPKWLDWVAVGGELGPNARPMHPDWVRSLRDQCDWAGIPFAFDGWGDWVPFGQNPSINYDNIKDVIRGYSESGRQTLGSNVTMFKAGSHKSGRSLDGREWNEAPPMTREVKRLTLLL